jgi:dTDP-4-dehydrorhamnose 3,5-epimerase
MKIHKTDLPDVVLLEPDIFRDERGYFMESFSEKKLNRLGIEFRGVQNNHCLSEKVGTLRGLHYQLNPAAQTKIVRVTSGEIFDVAVDIRKGSPTFGKWVGANLSAESMMQICVPKGFAHGYITLTPDTVVQYKVDEFYSPDHERSIIWNDPDIGIDWPLENPILAEKDSNAPLLNKAEINFTYDDLD